MKNLMWTPISAIMLAAALVGCGGSRSVDTSQLEKSFQTANAGSQSDVSQAVTGIKSGDFDKAVAPLRKVIQAGGLSEAQKDALTGVITNMQMVLSRNPKSYSLELYNSLSDLTAYLDGREPATR